MRYSLREKIYKKIRDDITFGKVLPGERLIEEQLSEKFKISRTPVREALRQLESEGLITFERNRGITIAKLSIKQVKEIYAVRCLLECYATRLTAERITEKDLSDLRDLQAALTLATKKLDLRKWIHNNMLFHDLLCERSGNQNLIQVLNTLKRRIYRYQHISVSIPGSLVAYLEHHEGVLKGCESKDGAMAEKYMKLHLETVQNILVDHLKAVNPYC